MKKLWKKLLAMVLVAAEVAALLPASVLAADSEERTDGACFDFEEVSYSVPENGGILEIPVTRYGEELGAAEVSWRAADFLSEYGTDYVILNEDGTPCTRLEGTKADPSEISFRGADEGERFLLDETSFSRIESTSTAKAVSTGSALFDARASLLGIRVEEDKTDRETADETEAALQELYAFFMGAQGCGGILHFEEGEITKILRVQLLDNGIADGERLFMLALLGVEGAHCTVSSGSQCYVSVTDDEPAETPVLTLSAPASVSPETGEATLTVRRLSGTQYFTTAYITTVTETLPAGAFEHIDCETVAFVPGQTEAEFTLRITDFSEGGTVGVRIFGEGDTAFETSYLSIDVPGGAPLRVMAASAEPVIFGTAQTSGLLESYSVWKSGYYTGSPDGSNYTEDGGNGHTDLCLYETTKNAGRAWITEDRIDVTGISSINYWTYVGGEGSDFRTYFELCDEKKFGGSVASDSFKGQTDWTQRTLNTSKVSGEHYLKFMTKALAYFNHNPRAKLGNPLTFNWTAFTFTAKDSIENFRRYLYDFTKNVNGQGYQKEQIFFDGETDSHVYRPGSVVIENSEGGCAGFYANSGATVFIRPADPEGLAAHGLKMSGVFLTFGSVDTGILLDYYQEYGCAAAARELGIVWLPVNTADGAVSLCLNRDLARIFEDHGATNASVYPVFAQEMVQVAFQNSDWPEGEADLFIRGRYKDGDHSTTTFDNIAAAAAADAYPQIMRTVTMQDAQGYRFACLAEIPKYSMVRVSMTTAPGRTPYAVQWFGEKKGTDWFEAGETLCNGTVVTETDHSKGEFCADCGVIIVPLTDAQRFTVSPFPVNGEIPDYASAYGSFRVYDVTAGAEYDTNGDLLNPQADAQGVYALTDAYLGETKSIYVAAPDGYYVKWTNMSGDTDGNGVIDGDESLNAGFARTEGADNWVYGNLLTVSLDTYDARWYYEFLPTGTGGIQRSASVNLIRDSSSFMRMAAGGSPVYTAVSDALVTIGGTLATYSGLNRAKAGVYTAQLGAGFPSSGRICVTVQTAGSADGTEEYNLTSAVERAADVEVPVLGSFTAKGISAAYTKMNESGTNAAGMIGSQTIGIADGTLQLTLTVLAPSGFSLTGAEYKLVTADGPEIACSDATIFTHKLSQVGSTYISCLTFNPQKIASNGDALWVRFRAQNGIWTPYMPTGYEFIQRVTLESFIFSIIGADTFTVPEDSPAADLLGKVDFGMSLGSIGAFDEDMSGTLTPSGMVGTDREADYTWSLMNFSAGFSKTIKDAKKLGNNSPNETKKFEEALDQKVEELAAAPAADTDADREAPPPAEENDDPAPAPDAGDDPAPAADEGGDPAPAADEGGEAAPAADADKDGKKTEKASLKASASFKWNITPKVGFNLTLSSRKNPATGKPEAYFEDLAFYVGVGFSLGTNATVTLPIGLSIIIKANLSGTITGVYYMYTDYQEDTWTEDAVLYDDNFSMFGSMEHIKRYGYLFINPVITIELGLKYGIIYVYGGAKFTFDMDFQFTDTGTRAYGTMDIRMSWGIKLLNFAVYSKNYDINSILLFRTPGQTKHISLDTRGGKTFGLGAGDGEGAEETFSLNTYAPRSLTIAGAGWATEARELPDGNETYYTLLKRGAADDPQSCVAWFRSNGKDCALLVFVGDDLHRDNENFRTLYWSMATVEGDETIWTAPQPVDDDGTLDDSPALQTLADGRILLAWSSAENKLSEGGDLNEALQQMCIKSAVFDPEKGGFVTDGEGNTACTVLTRSTELDRCTDSAPAFAYDPVSGSAILFYRKTEYRIREVGDFGKAYSTVAYLVYDAATDTWSNSGDSYTAEELARIAKSCPAGTAEADYLEAYKENWYGQRFLETGAECYVTDLAVAYVTAESATGTVRWAVCSVVCDWDGDSTTADDRDVIETIYDFDTGCFDDFARVTPESGSYCAPQYAQCEDGLFLFFGASNPETGEGEIRYYNAEQVVRNGEYRLVEADGLRYYTFTYEADDEGQKTEITVEPGVAIRCDNPADYRVSTDGRNMILVWTENVVDNDGTVSRPVFVSLYDPDSETAEAWSERVAITRRGESFSSVAGTIANGWICVVAMQAQRNSSSLMYLERENTALPTVTAVSSTADRILPGRTETLTVTVKNRGTKDRVFTAADTLTLTSGGAVIGSAPLEGSVLGAGETASFTLEADLPAVSGDELELFAECAGRRVRFTVPVEAELAVEDLRAEAEGTGIRISGTAVNDGNRTGSGTLEISCGGRTLGTVALAELQPGETEDFSLTAELTLEDYAVTGLTGTAEIEAGIAGSEEAPVTAVVTRRFGEAALALAQNARISAGSAQLLTGSTAEVLPAVSGVDAALWTVEWRTSSDEAVVALNNGSEVTAAGAGSAVLTGILQPAAMRVAFDANRAALLSEYAEFPGMTVTATVTVLDSLPQPEPAAEPEQPDEPCDGGDDCPSHGYTDVDPEAWYHEAVDFVIENGLFQGYEDRFAPADNTSRAMVVTVLSRHAGIGAVSGECPFTDVPAGSWYYDPVLWGSQSGVVNGISATEFAPDVFATREQLVTFLYRYAKLCGDDVSGRADLSGFADAASVSDWALEAVQWAVYEGIIQGRPEGIVPGGLALRCEFAAMVMRWCEGRENLTSVIGGVRKSTPPFFPDEKTENRAKVTNKRKTFRKYEKM